MGKCISCCRMTSRTSRTEDSWGEEDHSTDLPIFLTRAIALQEGGQANSPSGPEAISNEGGPAQVRPLLHPNNHAVPMVALFEILWRRNADREIPFRRRPVRRAGISRWKVSIF